MDLFPLPRSEILGLAPSDHSQPGSSHAWSETGPVETGPRADGVLDFSTISNPYGPSPIVLRVLNQMSQNGYAQGDAWWLHRALADHLELEPEQVLVGNGTAELFWLAALAYLRPADPVLMLGQAFSGYANIVRLMGARLQVWEPRTTGKRPTLDLDLPPAELLSAYSKRHSFQMVFLSNPNNPTGQAYSSEQLAAWAAAHPRTLFIVYETDVRAPGRGPAAIPGDLTNVVVLRSMTKVYGLAALRLAYAVGAGEVVSNMAKVRPAWRVSALAQAAGVAALEDQAFLLESQHKLQHNRRVLQAELRVLGYEPLTSAAHFFLLPVSASHGLHLRAASGAELRRALLECGVLVRDCSLYGLPGHVRVTTRRPEENARLLAALTGLRSS